MTQSHRRLFGMRLLIAATALLCTAAQIREPTPADLYGPLFEAVQIMRVFPDGKTFVDAVPREPVADIMADFAAEQPADAESLRRFVTEHFDLPEIGGVVEPVIVGPRAPMRDHIKALWPHLTRPRLEPTPGSSALPLDEPYVVPGGRFREIYYWDTYFTLLGLKADGQTQTVEAMLRNFEDLIGTYGHVPNGTRTYYLSRSQPPFFALMTDLSSKDDLTSGWRRLSSLRREHAYWMSGTDCLDATGACASVVRMPDGALLNRYWDDRDTPRDESWAEDVATAAQAPTRPAAEVYRDLRAAAESGWDFSSRWLDDPEDLSTIRTTDIVPVDLNSLLWTLERTIARRCREIEDRVCDRAFSDRARNRRAAITRYLWIEGEGRFADWDHTSRRATPRISAATAYPLFAGLATDEQAGAVALRIEAELLAPGGLRTTPVTTGQQWDTPNGWAPLQWVAIDGLERYGHDRLARRIAERWLGTVERVYDETGKMLEKYDIEQQRPGGGGEYPLQDGFGWTNGVTAALMDRYPATSRPTAPIE